MKKIVLMLFTLVLFVGCEKENDFDFDVTVDAKSISFKAIAGGAVMSYNIPESESIYGINVTYTSSSGEKMTVGGTYGSKELTIKGFLDGMTEVPAKVSYVSKNNQISKPIDVIFSTLPAGCVGIFKNMKVEPFWNGFSVSFTAPENVDGLINIGYMGISPTTGKLGVILKETRVITAGENILLYNNIKDTEETIKAVVWTEDQYQNEAKRASYDVMPKMTKKVDSSTLTYEGDSYEDLGYYKLSTIYLFDGDTNGVTNYEKKEGNFIFCTKNDVVLKPEGIIDLQEPKILAFFRMYVPLHSNARMWGSIGFDDKAAPNHFKLYASNNKDAAADEWVEMAEYYQSKTQNEMLWWCFPWFDPTKEHKSLESLQTADPCFIDVNFLVSETKYRYLKIQYLSLFNSRRSTKRVQCSEMEVFVEK